MKPQPSITHHGRSRLLALALSTILLVLAACQQAEDEVCPATTGQGHICLHLSADDALRTRTIQDVADASTWYAVVSNETGTLYDQQIGTELEARPFDAGTYAISVRNYNDADAANSANGGWGAAYHTGTASDIEVSAGGTAYVHINCGRALNAKFRLDYNEFSGIINAFTISTPKQLTFAYNDGTLAREAYFPPQTTITYTINYTIGADTKTTAPATLTLGGAATVSILRIKSDIHGNINLSMTCDDAFEDDANTEIDIDGTNGN